MLDDEIGRLSKERQQLASQLKEVGISLKGSSFNKPQLMYLYTWYPLIVVELWF